MGKRIKLSGIMKEIPINQDPMTKKIYQYDVVSTIFDRHGFTMWTAYDETREDENGFNEQVLILDYPDGRRDILNNTEENQQHFFGIIDRYFLKD